jgi:regulator of sigma D
MMDARRFHSGNTAQTQRPSAPHQLAPGTRIGYDPLLISRFKADHRRMLAIFTQVQELLIAQDFERVRHKLGEFRILLQDHLMHASTKLYIYVAHVHAASAETSARISAHRQEMLANSRLIIDFLRTYSVARLDDAYAGEFQNELLAIGAALVQRIELEETNLYPLYRPTT